MNKPASQQIEVQIMGQSYLLACPAGGEAALLDAVERVDTAMCRIRDAGKVKARDRIAVLASLNLAFELAQVDSRRNTETGDAAPGASRTSENTAATSPLNGTSPQDPATQARLDDLIRRLDHSLGSDGQLL
jgi:cell division protein ZapA